MLYVWYMAAVCQIGFSKESYSLLGPFGEPIVYIPTKYRENIFIGGRDMPPKRNSKRVSGGGILLPVAILTSVIFRGPSCV